MKKFNLILETLSHQDIILGKVIDATKPVEYKNANDEFSSLVKIIIGQQLSGAAAKNILNRVEKLNECKTLDPKDMFSFSNKELKLCGISDAKISYIKGLCKVILDNPNYFLNFNGMNENEILNNLCKIKGVGIWTASIFAMSTLNLENIFPYGDSTLSKAIKKIYGEKRLLDSIICHWHPYKSYACRVLWQWVDKGMPKY